MAEGTPARPLSPHLQIWRWSPTMASSILHRATGVALYGGTILLGVWLAAIAAGPQPYRSAATLLASPLALIVLFAFVWSVLFHTFNGLRHLYWDSGRGLDPNTAKAVSLGIFAATTLSAVAVFLWALRNAGLL